MDAKKFLIRLTGITLVTLMSFAGINYYVDVYGLFRADKENAPRVYVNERTSKYLFSYRYIPENFEGILIGPSLSANLNTKLIPDYKIYNSSIMGANISELRYLIHNIVDHGQIRVAIFCLDPYLTKDHGKKSALIDPKEFYGALGSTNLIKTYMFLAIRENGWMPGRFPRNSSNEFGFNNFNLEMDKGNARELIDQKVKERSPESTFIDSIAFRELKETVQFLKSNNVKVLAYFTPVPSQIMQINKENYERYQDKIRQAFDHDDVILDLNADEFKNITSDYNTFIDHGHLSEKGQDFVLTKINDLLRQHVEPKNLRYSER